MIKTLRNIGKQDKEKFVVPKGVQDVIWRNNWMIENSQYIICYITHITGGAAKFVERARKKKRNIINLS